MRITIQSFKLSLSTIFIGILLLPSLTRADAGEDYYKELRKLKKFDKTTLNDLKKKTVTAEQIKKVNETSRANNAYNKKLVDKNNAAKPKNEHIVVPKLSVSKKIKEEVSPSAPIKVNSDSPDELNFPGE